MLKVYALVGLVGVLGIAGYGAKYYYDSTQQTIATLRENNAQLKVAVQTAQASVESLQQDMQKFAELNSQLQADLQAAEAYGDELQSKLNRLDLVQDALRDPQTLEGKMNGATANLWRDIIKDTGGDSSRPLPQWLQSGEQARAGNPHSDQDREDTSASGESPQTNSAE